MMKKYLVNEWADLEGMTSEEVLENYGDDVVAFYANYDEGITMCEHSNGTFSMFGCGMDRCNIPYEEAAKIIGL